MPISFQGGQVIPTVGTPEYIEAQKLSESTPGNVVAQYNQKGGVVELASTPAPTIVSSNSVTDGNARTEALTTGGSSAGSTQVNPLLQGILAQNQQIVSQLGASGQDQLSALSLEFDAQLASNNTIYNSAVRQIQGQAENARQVALSNAVALNPYSQSRGAMTAANFTNAINSKYQALEGEIREKAIAADQLARAGYAKEAASIRTNIQSSINSIVSQTNQALTTFASMAQSQQQFNIQEQRLGTQSAATNFRGLLQQDLPSVKEVQASLKDGSFMRSPLYQEAINAGYTPDGAASLVLDAARAQEDKTGMEMAKFNLQLAAEERRSNTQSKIAMASNAINSVNNARAVLGTQGISYGSKDYSLAEVRASGQGVAPDPATRSSYLTTATAVSAVGNLATQVDSLISGQGGAKAVLNRFNAWAGNPAAENTQIIKGMVQPLYTLIGKGIFGQTGNMSDTDVQLVASAFEDYSKTSDVNTALRKSMVDLIRGKVSAQISLDAGSGINLTGLSPVIEEIYSVIDGVNVGGGNKSKVAPSTSTSVNSSVDDWYSSWIAGKTK